MQNKRRKKLPGSFGLCADFFVALSCFHEKMGGNINHRSHRGVSLLTGWPVRFCMKDWSGGVLEYWSDGFLYFKAG